LPPRFGVLAQAAFSRIGPNRIALTITHRSSQAQVTASRAIDLDSVAGLRVDFCAFPHASAATTPHGCDIRQPVNGVNISFRLRRIAAISVVRIWAPAGFPF
jgi:hypothetical protein